MYVNRFIIKIFLVILLLLTLVSCFDDGSEASDTIGEIYDSPDAITAYLKDLSDRYDFVQYQNAGYSNDGMFTVPMLILSDNPGEDGSEAELLIVGGIHGNEQSSVYVPLKLIEYLCQNYGTDEGATAIINDYETHFIPVLNPWGLYHKERTNSSGVDLNRNFSWAWVDELYHGEYAFDQSESRIIKDLSEANSYLLNVSFHAGERCISTVWDYIGTENSYGTPSSYSYETFLSSYLPNGATVFAVAQEYMALVNGAGDSEFYWIEGFDWYSTYGTLGDWIFGERGTLSYTIELSYFKLSSDVGELDQVWQWHKDALLSLYDMSDRMVQGRVVDSQSGAPVAAKISFEKQTKAYSDPVDYTLFSYSEASGGDFYQILDSGSYTLTLAADGYTSQSITVTAPQRDINVALVKE